MYTQVSQLSSLSLNDNAQLRVPISFWRTTTYIYDRRCRRALKNLRSDSRTSPARRLEKEVRFGYVLYMDISDKRTDR